MSTSAPPPGVAITDARLQEVAENVFAYIQPDGTWWINNTGFLVGRTGVVSVDACSTEARTRAYLDTIATVSDQPVRTLINTHHHGDHTFGNYLFRGATIVGHERIREEMLAFGPPRSAPFWQDVDWGDVELAPPFLTYTDQVSVWVDDVRCELRHVGTPAHTTNDSILWVPEQSVLFTGDLLFNGGTPFLLMGSIAGAIEAVEGLKQYPATTIVPGHGEVGGPEIIDPVLDYLRFVSDTAREAKAAGLSPLDAARQADLGRFADLLDAERIVGNLHRAYAELDGAERGARIDLAAALADMVTYNGGKPLTCYA
ncbi:MBL fold metallo-hydrolase [Pseudonocardia acidicola]|uniref:MBL fold metallo-hydrolase n=1 Tax=Pseudonocardia acidicola TaxID=2724939 RepID=A0ABX1SB63_9PSEU|nr:MBL fold metallo-hydrolase [Pseudonocardia acidicola]NMH97489.1 MBL fold metallo-hydrolase [Pseudonocardia acidicola]